jgi:hypothetical protein
MERYILQAVPKIKIVVSDPSVRGSEMDKAVALVKLHCITARLAAAGFAVAVLPVQP